MSRSHYLVLGLIAGVLGGVALVVACGDDDTPADAADAGCNCPPAEAPLTGRIRRVESSTPVGTTGAVVEAACSGTAADPTQGLILGGGCALISNRPGIVLKSGSMEGGSEFPGSPMELNIYGCSVENTTGAPTDDVLVATAVCLYPTAQ